MSDLIALNENSVTAHRAAALRLKPDEVVGAPPRAIKALTVHGLFIARTMEEYWSSEPGRLGFEAVPRRMPPGMPEALRGLCAAVDAAHWRAIGWLWIIAIAAWLTPLVRAVVWTSRLSNCHL